MKSSYQGPKEKKKSSLVVEQTSVWAPTGEEGALSSYPRLLGGSISVLAPPPPLLSCSTLQTNRERLGQAEGAVRPASGRGPGPPDL